MELVVATGNPHKVEEIRAILADVDPSLRVLGLHEVGGPFPEPAETGATFEENATIKARAYAAATGRLCLADDSGLEIDALGGRPGVISSHYSTDGRETGADRATRDAMNTSRVLRELEGVPPAERGARFRCVVVVAGAGVDITELSLADTIVSAGAGIAGSEMGRGLKGPAPQGKGPDHLGKGPDLECKGPVPECKGNGRVWTGPVVVAIAHGVFPGRIGVPPDVPRGGGGFGYDPIFLAGPDYARTSAELSAAEKHAVSHRGAALRALAALLRDGPGPLTRHADTDGGPDGGSDGGDRLDLDVDR